MRRILVTTLLVALVSNLVGTVFWFLGRGSLTWGFPLHCVFVSGPYLALGEVQRQVEYSYLALAVDLAFYAIVAWPISRWLGRGRTKGS